MGSINKTGLRVIQLLLNPSQQKKTSVWALPNLPLKPPTYTQFGQLHFRKVSKSDWAEGSSVIQQFGEIFISRDFEKVRDCSFQDHFNRGSLNEQR